MWKKWIESVCVYRNNSLLSRILCMAQYRHWCIEVNWCHRVQCDCDWMNANASFAFQQKQNIVFIWILLHINYILRFYFNLFRSGKKWFDYLYNTVFILKAGYSLLSVQRTLYLIEEAAVGDPVSFIYLVKIHFLCLLSLLFSESEWARGAHSGVTLLLMSLGVE